MYRIGIDLGGTNIAVGIVNDEHKIVVKKTTPTLATALRLVQSSTSISRTSRTSVSRLRESQIP